MSLTPKHVALIELAAAAYHGAYVQVREALARGVRGLPEHVFALDRLDVTEIAGISNEIARIELRRRQWRAALHAQCELAALDSTAPPDEPRAQDTLDPDQLDGLVAADGSAAVDATVIPALDPFISVVQYAQAQGCMYVDGRFEPVERTRR